MKICQKDKCTGCYACSNICPAKCISFIPNEYGHILPLVNQEKCINCNQCKKVCPSNNKVYLTAPQKAYASWSNDEIERETSASGGAASIFSKYIIESGGVVYGATQLKNGALKHERIDKNENLGLLKGSKYVQSSILDTYQKIREDLKTKNSVLFIGTPCQVGGLKNYLGKDYGNLYTLDIICHGVPGIQLLKDHLIHQIGHFNIDNISFREPEGYYLKVAKNNVTLYSKSLYRDYYFIGFMKGLFFRESCYSCEYACENRVSDMTIGDFWGLGKDKPFLHSTKKGVSLLLPVTDKGIELIENCYSRMFLQERSIIEAVKGNPQLSNPSIKHRNSEKFKSLYKKKGFNKASKKCLRLQRIKYLLLEARCFNRNNSNQIK